MTTPPRPVDLAALRALAAEVLAAPRPGAGIARALARSAIELCDEADATPARRALSGARPASAYLLRRARALVDVGAVRAAAAAVLASPRPSAAQAAECASIITPDGGWGGGSMPLRRRSDAKRCDSVARVAYNPHPNNALRAPVGAMEREDNEH